MRLLLLAMLLLGPSAAAEDFASSEVQRLSAEMMSLAQRNAWSGVERNYRAILELGQEPGRKQHLLGAHSARDRGDILNMIVRLEEAQAIEKTDDEQAQIDATLDKFGKVTLRGPVGISLESAEPPFLPDHIAAIDFAADALTHTGQFEGFLPEGDYTFGSEKLTVKAHVEDLVVDLGGAELPPESFAERAGVEFPMYVTVGGKKLSLNGVGLRQKAYIDVYVAALYLDVATKKERTAITRDEPKRIVMHFVYKRVSKRVLIAHWEEAFGAQPNASELTSRLEQLVDMMQDMYTGEEIVFDYKPGKGTLITINGKRQGTIKGKDFMEVLWSVWLGENPPSQKMKRDMLGGE